MPAEKIPRGWWVIVLGLASAMLASINDIAAQNISSAHGYYTEAQAHAGKQVFERVCAICHGAHLQGKIGPALAGHQFLSVSKFQKVTAFYFYSFMSRHMPLTAPGSLSKTQYLDIMAYFLQANGYPAGSRKLTSNKAQLEGIKIEPQPPHH